MEEVEDRLFITPENAAQGIYIYGVDDAWGGRGRTKGKRKKDK